MNHVSKYVCSASLHTGFACQWSGSVHRIRPSSDAETNGRIETTADRQPIIITNTLNDILADPISRKHLFPEGIIVRDGEVFNAQESNTFMIMQRCTAMLVSGSASSMSLSFGYTVTCSSAAFTTSNTTARKMIR